MSKSSKVTLWVIGILAVLAALACVIEIGPFLDGWAENVRIALIDSAKWLGYGALDMLDGMFEGAAWFFGTDASFGVSFLVGMAFAALAWYMLKAMRVIVHAAADGMRRHPKFGRNVRKGIHYSWLGIRNICVAAAVLMALLFLVSYAGDLRGGFNNGVAEISGTVSDEVSGFFVNNWGIIASIVGVLLALALIVIVARRNLGNAVIVTGGLMIAGVIVTLTSGVGGSGVGSTVSAGKPVPAASASANTEQEPAAPAKEPAASASPVTERTPKATGTPSTVPAADKEASATTDKGQVTVSAVEMQKLRAGYNDLQQVVKLLVVSFFSCIILALTVWGRKQVLNRR